VLRERERLAEAASDTPSTQALVGAKLGLRRQNENMVAIKEARLERMAERAGANAIAALAPREFLSG
jgi:hypothetical protein